MILALENHEDFTGPELASMVRTVDHPNLRILYDYGNSQMVLEDPEAALDATLPFVHSVHAKDHVMVRAEDSPHNKLTVAGVPMGEGFLPLRRLTKRLLDNGLRRVCFENVWAYSAFIRPHRTPLPGVVLGEGSFRYAQPPFDPQYLILDQSKFSGDDLVRMEKIALDRGTACVPQSACRIWGAASRRSHPLDLISCGKWASWFEGGSKRTRTVMPAEAGIHRDAFCHGPQLALG